MEKNYWNDSAVQIKDVSWSIPSVSRKVYNRGKKTVLRNGTEVGIVFIEGNEFISRNYEKNGYGNGPTFKTLTEAINWILYS